METNGSSAGSRPSEFPRDADFLSRKIAQGRSVNEQKSSQQDFAASSTPVQSLDAAWRVATSAFTTVFMYAYLSTT